MTTKRPIGEPPTDVFGEEVRDPDDLPDHEEDEEWESNTYEEEEDK